MPKSKKITKNKKKFLVNLKLKIAEKIDFLEVDRVVRGRKIWKPKIGVPYWMINSKGEVENRNYIFDEDTDFSSFREYINNKQILITK